MRQHILPHQINDDDWYTLLVPADNLLYQVTAQSSRRPVTTEPYPNFVVYSGLQIKRLHLNIYREVAPTRVDEARAALADSYQGHLEDGSSVQKHSAGGLYPYVIFAQETATGIAYGVIGPKKPNGVLVGAYHRAVEYAVNLKGGA